MPPRGTATGRARDVPHSYRWASAFAMADASVSRVCGPLFPLIRSTRRTLSLTSTAVCACVMVSWCCLELR